MRAFLALCLLTFICSSISLLHYAPIRRSLHMLGGDGAPKRHPSPRSTPWTHEPSVRPPDPWKALIKTLETQKSNAARFGKRSQSAGGSRKVADELQCPHFGTCSGCSLQGDFTNSPVMKLARRYFASQDIPFAIHVGNVSEWRTHVKFAVQPMSKWGGLKFGLYKSASHLVQAIPHCQVQAKRINEAAEVLRLAALEVGVQGYVEASARADATGELRYVQFTVERTTNKIQLVLVWNAENYRAAGQALPRLVKRVRGRPDLWHSVSVNFHTKTGNHIVDYDPKNWKVLWGPPSVREKVGNATFSFRPQIFRQANLDMFESSVIPCVLQHIPVGAHVAELYSGLGIIGINAISRAQTVRCSDSNVFVDEVFEEAIDSLAGGPLGDKRDSISFECLSADEAVVQGQCEGTDLLVVDPPRRGLTDGVRRFLLGEHEAAALPETLRRMIYVGCGFEAVERDVRELAGSGLWRIRAATGFALFPGSDHIETVVVLDRTGKQARQANPSAAAQADRGEGEDDDDDEDDDEEEGNEEDNDHDDGYGYGEGDEEDSYDEEEQDDEDDEDGDDDEDDDDSDDDVDRHTRQRLEAFLKGQARNRR